VIQKRLDTIVRELAQLKARQFQPNHEIGWGTIVGIAKNYPESDDVVRLGKELRQRDRPKG
jgi:hypothetical protein